MAAEIRVIHADVGRPRPVWRNVASGRAMPVSGRMPVTPPTGSFFRNACAVPRCNFLTTASALNVAFGFAVSARADAGPAIRGGQAKDQCDSGWGGKGQVRSRTAPAWDSQLVPRCRRYPTAGPSTCPVPSNSGIQSRSASFQPWHSLSRRDPKVLLTLPPGGYTTEIAGAEEARVDLCAIYQLP